MCHCSLMGKTSDSSVSFFFPSHFTLNIPKFNKELLPKHTLRTLPSPRFCRQLKFCTGKWYFQNDGCRRTTTRSFQLQSLHIYRMSQKKCARFRENVPYVKVHRYNPKHLYPKLNGYGDNGKRNLKLWQLLHAYWLPNSYWNWQEYVVSVMLTSVLNIRVTCEWHKAIKLNYKNTRTHITVVLKVTKHCTYRQ